MLGWIAAAGYLVASALCGLAGLSARAFGPKRTVSLVWVAIALLFVALAASRMFAVEDHVRAILRLWLSAEGEYEARRTIQGPIAAVLLVAGGLGAIALMLGARPAGQDRAARALAWALRGAAVMIGLVALRIVSLHATDALLYAPVHLNWVIDTGATVVVAACAWTFVQAAASRQPRGITR